MDHGFNQRSKTEPGRGQITGTSGGAGVRTQEGFDSTRGRFYQAGLTGVLGFLGLPGTGKTTLMLEKLWPARRVVIFNTVKDFGYADPEKQKPLPGFHFFADIHSFADALLRAKAESWPQVRFCFSPVRSTDEPMKIFEATNRLVQDFGNCIFAVPEIWKFQQAAWSPKDLENTFVAWRHYGICFMWDAQFTQKVDKTLIRVSTELFCGRIDVEGVNSIRKYSRLPASALDLLPTLPDWHFIHRLESGAWTLERP